MTETVTRKRGARRTPPAAGGRAGTAAPLLTACAPLSFAISIAASLFVIAAGIATGSETPTLVRIHGGSTGAAPAASPSPRLVPIGAAPVNPLPSHAAPPLVRIGAGSPPPALGRLPVAAPAVAAAPVAIRSLPVEPVVATPVAVRPLPLPAPIPAARPVAPTTIASLPVPDVIRPQSPIAPVSVAPPALPRPLPPLPPIATAQPERVIEPQPPRPAAAPVTLPPLPPLPALPALPAQAAAAPPAAPAAAHASLPPLPPLATAQPQMAAQPQARSPSQPVPQPQSALPPLPPLAAAQPQAADLPTIPPAPAATAAAAAVPAADELASRSIAPVPPALPPTQPQQAAIPPAAPQPEPPPPQGRQAGPGKPADSIVIGSFNIQVFGEAKLAKKDVVDVLARVVRGFDVVAIQEVRAKSDSVIPQFVAAINADGSRYQHVIGPRLGRTSSKEQYTFVYDTTRIEIDPGSVGTLPDPEGRLHRPPLHARFRVKADPPESGFTFWLVDTHTDPDEVKQEVDALADVFVAMRSLRPDEDDVILLGDFNAAPAQFGRIRSIPGIGWSVSNVTTNTRRTKTYDNLVFVPGATAEYTGRWGVLDLQDTFGLSLDKALEVSDHNPVWAAFRPWEAPRVPLAAQPAAAGTPPPR